LLEQFKRERKFKNLFYDSDTKERKTLFFIDGQDSLSNCWLHFSASGDIEKGEVFAFLSSLYYLIDFFEREFHLTKKEYEFHMLVEESESSIYFTIQSYYLAHIINENDLLFKEFDSKIYENIITFKISIVESNRIFGRASQMDLTIYDFIPKDELNRLDSLSIKLSYDILDILEFGFSRKNINSFTSTLFEFSKIIQKYEKVKRVSDEVESFVFLLKSHIDKATTLETENLLYFESFVNHLNLWLKKCFFSGVEDIDLYSDNIKEDLNNLHKILTT